MLAGERVFFPDSRGGNERLPMFYADPKKGPLDPFRGSAELGEICISISWSGKRASMILTPKESLALTSDRWTELRTSLRDTGRHSRGTPGSHCVALPMSSFPSLPRHGFSRSRSTNASSCGRSSCPIASQEDRLAMNPPTGCEALRLASIPARDLRNLKRYGWLSGSDSSVTSNQKVRKFHTSPPDRSCLR